MNNKLYFCGNEISAYGQQYRRVDYGTFAKAFDAVLNNNIMSELESKGFYFEQIGGFVDNNDEIDELREQIEELESHKRYTENGVYFVDENGDEIPGDEIQNKIDELTYQIDDLENDMELPEVYQWYIVSSNAVDILSWNNEIVFYNDDLDIYLWGVTHYGTGWDYVLTDIRYDENGHIIRG